MKKTIVSFSIILLLSIILSTITKVRTDAFFTSTIFTVSGIMFSIGLGLVATFNLNGIKNINYIKSLRSNINYVRNNFLSYFMIATLCYILDQYIKFGDISLVTFKRFTIIINFSTFFCLCILYCASYFVVNFLQIQKLNNEIFDKLNKEN